MLVGGLKYQPSQFHKRESRANQPGFVVFDSRVASPISPARARVLQAKPQRDSRG